MAQDAFAFLLAMGFDLAADGPYEVRYESAAGVFVRVFHATDDHYLGFRVGLTAEPRDAVTERELLAVMQAPELPGLFPNPTSLPKEALSELARRLRNYGARALAGDRAIFDKARVLRRAHTEGYTRAQGDAEGA